MHRYVEKESKVCSLETEKNKDGRNRISETRRQKREENDEQQ